MGISATKHHLWGMNIRFIPSLRLVADPKHFPPVDGFWITYPQNKNIFFVLLRCLLYFGFLNGYPPYMGVGLIF
jgi:hypothetical protein